MTQTNSDIQLATLALIALLVLVFLPGFGMMGMGSMMGGMWGGTTVSGWTMVLGVAMQALVVVVLVGGGYLVYTGLSDETEDVTALDELRMAYARGEIDDEEFQRRRDVLERDA